MACGHPCGCATYREHLLSISVASSALPSRNPEAASAHRREATLDKDAPAYKRLRANGLQPKGIDGCARLEQMATKPIEVESGVIRSDVARSLA